MEVAGVEARAGTGVGLSAHHKHERSRDGEEGRRRGHGEP